MGTEWRVFTLFSFLIMAYRSTADNILMNPIIGQGSHFYLSASIGEQLVRRGHNITFLVGNAYEDHARSNRFGKLFNFEVFTHPIPAEEVRGMFEEMNENMKPSASFKRQPFFKLLEARQNDCKTLLNDDALLTRLRASKFSAILYDTMWICGAIVGEALDIPHFAIAAFPNPCFLSEMKGSGFNPSFLPTMMTPFSAKMTFLQRVGNAVMYLLLVNIGSHLVIKPYQNLISNFEIPDPNDLMRRSKLFLVNSDFAGEYPCALAPNVIPVGGLTVQYPTPLPSDLENFVTGSGHHGVIICSFGSFFTLGDDELPLIRIFSDVFSRLPQRIVWQVKGVPHSTLPPNVKTLPWLPLNDLLGHPSTRALLYHGGHNSFYEALFHGVPTVVIPIHGDQIDTAWRTVHLGLGLQLSKTATVGELYETLEEVTTNQTYMDNVKRRSAIFRDRPMRPAERAAFWIEHAITHGTDYMDMPLGHLNVFQYYLIDVIAFMLGICIVLLLCMVKLCSCTCRQLCCRSHKEKDKSE